MGDAFNVTEVVGLERAACPCGRVLGRRNRSGKCRACHNNWLNSDPDVVARRHQNQRAWAADPAVKSMLRERMANTMRNLSDAEIERRREAGKVIARTVLNRPDVIARTNAPEVRARAGRTRTNTLLAWCPPEYRDEYRLLCSRGKRATEARRIIEGRMALAALGPDVQRWHEQRALFGQSAPAVRVRSEVPAPARKLIDLNAVPSSMEQRYGKVAA